MKPPENHVIFLGAGASATSGYPVGNGLRLNLSCRKRFRSAVEKALGGNSKEVEKICKKHFEIFGNSMELFRNGAFATVDEFSKLMSGTHPEQVQEMKKLMRLAFFFHNPEDDFAQSDYYAFIQRLFRDDDLSGLKSNITVISYNYDFYFDFLLDRAYKHRQGLEEADVKPEWKNKLTSGFFDPTTEWTIVPFQFNYFKLHGSIGYAGKQDYSWHNAFSATPLERMRRLADVHYKVTVPPVIFPWELFDGSGRVIKEDDFIFVSQARSRQQKANGRTLFNLYKALWKGAREAVEGAQKISFVGLSMHPFLEDGLRYLFGGKSDATQVVVANPDNEFFREAKNRLHPASLCGRVSGTLGRVAPKVKYVKSHSEDDGTFTCSDVDVDPKKEAEPDITPRYSFKEFIEREMN